MKLKEERAGDGRYAKMPCGGMLDLRRMRSEGVLTAQEISFCRDRGFELAYDPMQIGWVPAGAVDDFHFSARPKRRATARMPQINGIQAQLGLRAWEPSDVAAYRALLDDRDVWAHLPEAYPDPLTEETAAALIELSNASNHHSVFAVLRDSVPVGQVRLLYDVDEADAGTAEISYWLGKQYWGKGIGTKIVARFSSRCFADNPGITRLLAKVHRDNAGSAAVLRKAGYECIGTDPKDTEREVFTLSR